MVIDFHTHLFPDKLAERAIKELTERANIPAYSGGDVSSTCAAMQKDGVNLAVVQNIATNAHQMHKVNLFAIELDKEPDFISFGSVHYEGDWEYELDMLKDNGIKGIKLHPDYQGFYINESKMQRVYEGILKRGFIIMFHAGLDVGYPDPIHATPERISETLGLFRGEKVVFAHSGGFKQWEGVKKYLIGEDIYIDTSISSRGLTKTEREELYCAHNENKILFATDFPWSEFKYEIDEIKKLDLTDEQKEKILHINAEKLLKL